jgi:hypothetical protein
MNSLNIHWVKGITITDVQKYETTTWRKIIVTDKDGDRFEINLFGKPENLEIVEVEK